MPRWSVSRIQTPKHPGFTVRIVEPKRGASLLIFWWEGGRQRARGLGCKRTDLGSTEPEQKKTAKQKGAEFIEFLALRAMGSTDDRAPRAPLTLGQLYARYAADGLLRVTASYKKDQLGCVRRCVEFFGESFAVANLKPSHIEKYLVHREAKGLKVAGRRDLVGLGIACNWAMDEGILAANPIQRARKKLRRAHAPSRPFYTVEEFERLLAVADEVQRPYPTHDGGPESPQSVQARETARAFPVLLALAWHSGRRISAILSLKWDYVTLKASATAPYGSVTWYAGVQPDGKKFEQTVRMFEPMQAVLAQWKQTAPPAVSRYVFPSPRVPSRPMEFTTVEKWLRRAEKLAGIAHKKQGGWHAFRRGCISQLLAEGYPLPAVAWYVGHRDQTTTLQAYSHATPNAIRNIELRIA